MRLGIAHNAEEAIGGGKHRGCDFDGGDGFHRGFGGRGGAARVDVRICIVRDRAERSRERDSESERTERE